MSKPFSIYSLVAAEIIDEYPSLWATIQKYFPDEGEDKQALIASLVIGTCGHCHENATGCACWNDE
jgi:hypothetical protein